MSESGKTASKVLLALLVLAALVAVASGVWVYRNPLALHVRTTRGALAELGLERTEVELEDATLIVWQGGRGPDVVFLHGAGDQAGAWSGTVGVLLDDYRVHLVDLPGHGESDPRLGPLPYSTVLAGVEGFLERFDSAAPPIVVGHSLGGWLGMVYAHRHPGRIARLVAVNGGALRNEGPGVNFLPRHREEARQTMAALRDPSSPPVPGFVLDDIVRRGPTGPLGRFVADLGELERHLLDGRLGEIPTPVDLIWGESDRHFSLDYARRLERQLPASRLSTLERCGHLPPNECPLRFRELLRRALGSEPPTAAPTPQIEPEGVGDDPR